MSGTDGSERADAALASAPPEIRASAARVCAASDFVRHALATDADLLPALIASGDLERSLTSGEYAARVPAVSEPSGALEAEWMAALRRWRRREFVRIA